MRRCSCYMNQKLEKTQQDASKFKYEHFVSMPMNHLEEFYHANFKQKQNGVS